MTHSKTSGFCGRGQELAWLRGHFEGVATRNTEGQFPGPRMAVVLAESGIGKSRLVQELYIRLTEDPAWDPPEVDYWPAAFGDGGVNLLVVPSMKGHVPKGPPRFAWLGARWQCPDERNTLERRSVLPDLRASVTVHAEVLRSHGSAWSEVLRRSLAVGREEALGVTADAMGIPFFGLLSRVARDIKEVATDRHRGPKRFEDVEDRHVESEVDEVLEVVRSLLDGRGTLPTVLWLDDAQWIDPESLQFVNRLWAEARRRRWPLLLVVTHWEREWRELALAEKAGTAGETLHDLVGQDGVDVLHLRQAEGAALQEYLVSRLPGITAEQQSLLVSKAAGNFLTMVENVSELLSEPMHFLDERTAGALTEEGVEHIREFETGRVQRVQQRFKRFEPEVRKLLGWSTRIGSRFIAEVVEEFARERLQSVDPANALERCVDPYVVLGKPSPMLREFRDKVFHQVASEYRERHLKSDSERVAAILRRHLIEWINNSFDADGTQIWPDEARGIAPPPRSATGLSDRERRDLLDLARAELPLPAEPDWENPVDVAALRAVYLAVITDSRDNRWGSVRTLIDAHAEVALRSLPARVISLNDQEWLADTAQTAGALKTATHIVRAALIQRRRLHADLGTPGSRRDLSISLSRMADLEQALGDLPAARDKFTECLTIDRALDAELGTPGSRRDLSVSLRRMGDLEQALGDLPAARDKFDESLAIARVLVTELGTPESRRDLSISLDRMGALEQALGDLPAARDKFAECLGITRALDAELATPESRRDLSVSLGRMGDLEQALGDLPAARDKFTECLAIDRALDAELATPESRRDLSISLDRMGALEQALGDLPAAKATLEQRLSISRSMHQSEQSVQSLNDVIWVVHLTANCLAIMGDWGAAQALLAADRNELLALQTHCGGDANMLDTCAAYHETWAKVSMGLGDPSAANSHREKAAELRAQIRRA